MWQEDLIYYLLPCLVFISLLVKAWLHYRYYLEMILLKGCYFFLSEPVVYPKSEKPRIPLNKLLLAELITPDFSRQKTQNKSHKALALEKQIKISLIIFYVLTIATVSLIAWQTFN